MANGVDPYAFFQTPEFGQMDLFERWMNFQQAVAEDQDYLNLTPQERSYVRKNVVGYQSEQEFYPQVQARIKEFDAETQHRLFNTLMNDDVDWHDLPAAERQATRKELLPAMDVGGTHPFGGQGVKYEPPEGYEIPHRPLGPPPGQPVSTPELAQEQALREERSQLAQWEPVPEVQPLQQFEPPTQPVPDEQAVLGDQFTVLKWAKGDTPEAQRKWAIDLLQPFQDVANMEGYGALPQEGRSAAFTDVARENESYAELPLEAKVKIRDVFVNDPSFNPQVSEPFSPEGFWETAVGAMMRGEATGSGTALKRYQQSVTMIDDMLRQYEESKGTKYEEIGKARAEKFMPGFIENRDRYLEKWAGANAAMTQLGTTESTRKINLINLEVMEQMKDVPMEKGLIRGTADWFRRTKAFLDEVDKQGAWGDLLQFVGETTTESAISFGMNSLPTTVAMSFIAGPVIGPMVGAGTGSYLIEFSSAFTDTLRDAGIDVTDPEALKQAMSDPVLIEKAKSFANARAVPIAMFDVLSAGIAGTGGRALAAPSRALSRTAKVGAGAGLLGQAAVLGAGGEAAAQKVAGQQLDPLAIGVEALAEVAQAPVEVSVAGAAQRYGPVNIRAKQLQLGLEDMTEEERIAVAATRPPEGKYGDIVTTWDTETNELRMGVMGKNGKIISPAKMTLTPEQAEAYEARRAENEIAGLLPSVSEATVREKLARFEARQREGDMSREVGAAHLANIIDSLTPEDAEVVMDRAQEIADDRLRQRGLPSEMFEPTEEGGLQETDITAEELELINFGAVRDALYDHLGVTPEPEPEAAAVAELPEDLAERTEAFEERAVERERPRDQIDEVQEELAGAGYGEAATILGKYRTGEPLTTDEYTVIEEAQAQVDPDVGTVMQGIRDAALAPIDEVQRKADVNTVLTAINEGNETVKDLAAATGLEPDRVRIYANELAEAGRVDARPFEGVDKPARFTPAGEPTAGEAQQAAELPAPTRTRGSRLAVGDLIESPDLGPATITKIEQQGRGIRVVTYRDAIGNTETMSVRPTTYTDVYQKAAVEAEPVAAAPVPAEPEPPAAPAQKELLQEKADRYTGLINAADTTEELRAVEEQWGREKSKPWGSQYGVDAAFARKRRLLRQEEAATAALEPGPREEAAPPEAPEPAVEAEPVVTPEEAARLPDRGVYGADGQLIGETRDIEVPGVEIPDPVPVDAVASERDVMDALKKMAGVEEDAVLDEYLEEDALPAEEEEARGEEEVQEEEAVEEEVEEIVLPELEQKMLDEIKGGRTSVSEIQRAIGRPRDKLIKTMKSLNKKGLINLVDEPTGRAGESPRLRASLPEEGAKAEPLKRKTKAERKVEAKQTAEERAAAKVEKLKQDLDKPITVADELAEARKRESEAGVVRINNPERRENRSRTEAVEDHTGWEYRTVRDYLMRGKTGMSSAMKAAWDKAGGVMEGHRREAQADFNKINRAIDGLLTAGRFQLGRKRKEVWRAVNMFWRNEGIETAAELAAMLKVPDDHKSIKIISDARDRNSARHQQILDSPHIPEVVKEAMKDQQFYLRLAYTRYLTDKRLFGKWRKFSPDETNRQEAINVLGAAFDKEVRRTISKFDELRAELPSSFDFVGFLQEFQAEPPGFEDLSAEMKDRLRAFRKTFRNWKQAIQFHTALDGESVYAVREADALRRYAEVGVEQLLTKGGIAGVLEQPGGRIDVNHLERRVLSDVFRRLYGEIEDPAVLQALTVEAQGTLLSQFMFFEEMMHHGQDIVWAEGKADSPRLTAKLGDENNPKDVFKYGSLTGTYVDPLFKQFLDRKGSIMVGLNNIIDLATVDEKVLGAMVGKAFKGWQGTTRMMALMTLGAWWRNYLSSYLTFALQAGDVMHSGFNTRFFKYTIQALKVAVGNDAAVRELAEDMKAGAFKFSAASIVSDFQPAVKDHVSRLSLIGALKSIPRKIKESYILIDYAAKKAAYESRIELAKERVPGISQEDAETYAREHVEKYYQNADRVPAFVATIGRVGMGDFLGFQYDSGRMAINAAVNVLTSLDRQASRPGDKLYRWKGILNKYPELQDTWETTVGFTAARGIGLGIWGPGQYLLAVGPANAVLSVTFGQLMQSLKFVDEDDEIEATTAEEERALNELGAFYDANAQKYTYKLTNPTTGKVSYQMVPLSNQFGNAFEDVAVGIAQRAGVGEESLADIASFMLRPENLFNNLPGVGMTYQNAIRAWTGYDPQSQMTRSNFIDAARYAKAGRFGDAGDEAGDAMMGWLADTTGGVGRMWKRYKVYEQREGRTPVAGSRKRRLEKEGVEKLLDITMPMIRPLRIVTFDDEEIRRILPYKLGPLASKVAGMRAGMREPVRAARDYLEGASEEELAKGLAAKAGYIIALREMEERIKDMRPVIDAVGVPDETLIQELMEGMPAESKMRRAEAEAVVRGTVDTFEFSDDFYTPEQKPTGLMKGEDIVEKALRDNPNVSWRYLYNVLSAGGYKVGTHAEFQARYGRIKRRIYK